MTPTTPRHQGTESQFEATTIERLRALGYQYQPASLLERDLKSVVLADRLRAHLAWRYPHLPEKVLDEAVAAVRNPDGVTLDQRNMAFHQMLTRGYELKYEADGQDRYEHIYFIDWDELENNDFLVVNQLTVEGQNTRRPFEFNAFCVLSDGVDTLQGMYSSEFEWFTPWKSIDGRTVEPETTGSMKTLIEGLFPKARLLDYIRNFIVHEVVHEQITKKGAKYHQYFAVRFAVEKALEDEIRLRRRSNLAKHHSFQEMLEDALRRYHNNTIQAAEVVPGRTPVSSVSSVIQ